MWPAFTGNQHDASKKVSESDLAPFLDKDYRDAYLDGYVKTSIALQINALRTQLGLTQNEFADKLGVTQSIVSRLENTEYGSVTINTLLKVAKENAVALDVKFVAYPKIIASGFKEHGDAIRNIFESFEQLHTPITPNRPTTPTSQNIIFIAVTDMKLGEMASEPSLNLGVLTWQNQQALQVWSSVQDINYNDSETPSTEKYTPTIAR